LPASLPRTRTLLTTRRRWRNRVSVRRRASGRVHYNYFRDYDPAVGRYVESDPIGLNGGLNPFSYSSHRPTESSDSFGLFSVSVVETLNFVGQLPNPKGLGLTLANRFDIGCKCAQNCSGGWSLQGCSINWHIEVLLRSGLTNAKQRAFARISEYEHVSDLRGYADGLERRGEEFEDEASKRSFDSEKNCINHAVYQFTQAFRPILNQAYADTISRRHTYRHPFDIGHQWNWFRNFDDIKTTRVRYK
jgi:RHS repeat-associated protein